MPSLRIHITHSVESVPTKFSVEDAETQKTIDQLVGVVLDATDELRKLRGEVKKMADTQQEQDAKLSSDIAALTAAFTNFQTAVQAEIATLSASPAAADPAVATAITNIEALTATINAATAAATPTTTNAPEPVGPEPVGPGTPVVTDPEPTAADPIPTITGTTAS